MAMSWPLDGVYNKHFRTTSSFGWRVHPIQKTRKHHNGEDLISTAHDPAYLKAIWEGVVLDARPAKSKKTNGEPNGYGYFVSVRHRIGGKDYVALYAHCLKGSFQVKAGDKVKAGQVLAILGNSGASTGPHLHFEIHVGKKVGWSSDGSGFLDPMPFLEALEKFDGVVSNGPVGTPEDAPTQPMPNHTPSKPVKVSSKPNLRGVLKVGSKGAAVRYLQGVLDISVDGVFGQQTRAAVHKFQKEQGLVSDGIVGAKTWSKIPPQLNAGAM